MAVRNIMLASAAWTALMAASQALAQDQAGASNASEDIVVTAQKREQLLIDVPQSISVIGGAALEEQHATDFSGYLKLVPGLQLNQDTPGAGRLVLRGINTGGVASTVSVYLDESPFGSSSGLVNGAVLAGDFDTFDVARVEVLRGPQGTIYGASSLGGVMKFVTNAPSTEKLEVRGRVGVETTKGGDESYSGQLMVNVPLGDMLAVRASGFYRKNGGFIDSIGTAGSDRQNNINDSRSYGGRASLLFTPSDALSVRLTAVLQNIEADAASLIEADPVSLKPLYGRLSLSQFVPPFSDVNYRLYNGTINYDFGFATLTSATSYSTQDQTTRDDLTTNLGGLVAGAFGVPNDFALGATVDSEKITQELRLASASSDVFEWLVGGYYTHEKGRIHQVYTAYQPGTLTPIAGLPLLADLRLNSKYEEIAGFANATLHLGNRFDIDFGGRYSHNKQSARQVGDGALAGGAQDFSVKSSENVFTYSVAPKIKFGERASIYARVAKGFRPGGPNVVPPAAPSTVPRTYDSDSLVSYEIGVKAQTADNMLSIDAALFHIDWKDIQLFAAVNGFGVNVNGAGAQSDGFELTTTLRPAPGFDVSVNGAFTNARLKDDTSPLVGGLKGDRLPFTPKFSVAANTNYRWSLGGDTEAYVGGGIRFVGEQSGAFDATYRAANGRQRRLPSYEQVDLNAGVDFGPFSIEAYVKNLTNSLGYTSTSAITANGLPVYPNSAIGLGVTRPRVIGLSLSAKY